MPYEAKYIASARTRDIVFAGLSHWSPVLRDQTDVVFAAVLEHVRSGEPERTFIREGIDGLNDPRWVGVLYRTAAFSIYEATRRASMPKLPEYFLQVDGRICEKRGHRDFHGMCAPSDDPVWEGLEAPFAWLCSCSTLFVSERDLMLPAKPFRVNSHIVRHNNAWLDTPLDRFLNFL